MSAIENNALISEKVKRIYAITAELEDLYPGRHFTPDGHMVGSIGEVLVAENYGLKLLPASYETHDAVAPDGRYVQIKATQVKQISISSEPDYGRCYHDRHGLHGCGSIYYHPQLYRY